MIDVNSIPHHRAIEEISDVLALKTNNKDKTYFRMLTAFMLGKMASCMRVQIQTRHKGKIPINTYLIALATSGFGKGASKGILEDEFIEPFRERFIKETFPIIAEQTLYEMAVEKSNLAGTDAEDELKKLQSDFYSLGSYPFKFDSGSSAALRQIHNKCGYARSGAVNFEVDEIGSNLQTNTELYPVYLEMYDKGTLNLKITKQSATAKRAEDLNEKVPANMLFFGTPSKIFDEPTIEKEFYSLLNTGYARRCFFAHGYINRANEGLSPTEIYQQLTDVSNMNKTNQWANHFLNLADPARHGMIIDLPDDVAILLIEYQVWCEARAKKYPENADIKKSEMAHRYFKCMKLAGIYAFIDESLEITKEHLYSAIKLTEESGDCFETILSRENNAIRLAKYIASVGIPMTHYDLHEALPFYKESASKRREMLALATQWGYKNNIIIKQETISPNIELISGETLKPTNLEELIISISQNHNTYGFEDYLMSFDDLPNLATNSQYQWANHYYTDNARSDVNTRTGFNMVVLDIDGTADINEVATYLEEYNFFIYTTKSHTDNCHRFRLILPIKYILHLDQTEYKTFMNNIIEWLPFESDHGANQRARTWLMNETTNTLLNKGETLDPTTFIAKTSMNNIYKEEISKLTDLTAVERWFALKMQEEGARNNNLLKYALMLKDSGIGFNKVSNLIIEFNSKLPSPLSESEIKSTILKTLQSKY